MNPYEAMFGNHAFDFGDEIVRHMMIDQKSESRRGLHARLTNFYRELFTKTLGSHISAAFQYNKPVREIEFYDVDRMMV